MLNQLWGLLLRVLAVPLWFISLIVSLALRLLTPPLPGSLKPHGIIELAARDYGGMGHEAEAARDFTRLYVNNTDMFLVLAGEGKLVPCECKKVRDTCAKAHALRVHFRRCKLDAEGESRRCERRRDGRCHFGIQAFPSREVPKMARRYPSASLR